MNIFKGFNQSGDSCPICGTNDNKSCTLIPVDGTESGNNIQCIAVHLDCLDLGAAVCGNKMYVCGVIDLKKDSAFSKEGKIKE